ncbi:MAG TPA: EamA family transporter [Opitutales bacterium]|nr:EamA family transporter [Opitutales bacterium]
MEPFHFNATLAAVGYAVAAVFSKQALSRGAGILRFSFGVNMVFVPVFATLLLQHEGSIPWNRIHYPAITGALFFLGQVFTFAAIRFGDVSLQTPTMGTKAVFAVLLAAVCGTEAVGFPMFLAAFVAMLGVALLGFSGNGKERVGLSITLALLSSFFFAGSDTMVGVHAGGFGVPAFLFIAISTNALLSFAMIPYFREPLRTIPKDAWPWMLAACLLMGLQALLLNYTLGRYQHVAEINVLYTTRGLWSVLFGALAARLFQQSAAVGRRRMYTLRFMGAFLMCLAIAILFKL